MYYIQKTTVFLCLIFLSCSSDKGDIMVQYSASTGNELLSSTFFDDMEIIVLHGEGTPLFGPYVSMIAKNDTYYIADHFQSGKIYLFDKNGKYLYSVGELGRGKNEYLALSDMAIEKNGDISIYSSYEGMLYTFSPLGHFLRNTEFVYKSANLASLNGFNYHFFGDGSGASYQLYITDEKNCRIDSCIISPSNVPHFSPSPPVFTLFKGMLNLCLPLESEIYRLKDEKWSVSYRFDLGEYTVPTEYYSKTRNEAMKFLLSQTVAIKGPFFENQKYAVLQVTVCDYKQGLTRINYGLLEKATSTWTWYYVNENDFLNNDNLKYMDDLYIYFIVEPALMKGISMIDRFPLFSEYTEEDGVVILKCRLR